MGRDRGPIQLGRSGLGAVSYGYSTMSQQEDLVMTVPDDTQRAIPQHKRASGDRSSLTVARTMKALGIVQRIQAETDPGEWEKHWAAANHSRRPANKRLLYPFQVHCREWPSAETWETVAAVGRTFTVQRP